jgi:hypothetical protein
MNKKQLVEDLVSTFEDRNALHAAYKEKMKGILLMAIVEFIVHSAELKEGEPLDPEGWVDSFVESHFKRDDEGEK